MKQRYDSYKPSYIDWIGDIPSHWKVVRLAHIFNAKAGGDAKPELYSDTKDAQHPFPVFTNSLLEEQVYAYTSSPTFQSGSITVTGRGEIGHAFLRNTDFDAIIRLLVLTPRIGLCCKYFTYFIDGVMEFFSDSAAVSQLSAQQINKELLIIPPLAEQEAIAAWLDTRCGEIDAAIAKVDREIELIDELKQSEISRVVTSGLNPDGPLRSSGIDWIGDIPQYWQIKRLRYVCEFRNGYTPSKANDEFWSDGTIPWYRMEDIRESGRFLKEAKQYISTEAIKGCGLFEGGSFILATTATIGEHAMLIVDSLANQQFTNLKIRKSLSHPVTKEFFFYFLFVIDEFCKSTTKTTTFPAMDMTDLKNFGVPIPPLTEQQAIADYLDKKCAEIDGLKAKLTKKRETLTELRQSIISEVVTGKRKVV